MGDTATYVSNFPKLETFVVTHCRCAFSRDTRRAHDFCSLCGYPTCGGTCLQKSLAAGPFSPAYVDVAGSVSPLSAPVQTPLLEENPVPSENTSDSQTTANLPSPSTHPGPSAITSFPATKLLYASLPSCTLPEAVNPG